MRARERCDWTQDLNERHTIEREVERALQRHDTVVSVRARTASKDDLDFVVTDRRRRELTIELKTKRQLYGSDWSQLTPDVARHDLFVLDELTVRKMAECAPHSYLLIRDLVWTGRWVVMSFGDLLTCDRVQMSRQLLGSHSKGKWLISMKDAPIIEETISDALDQLNLLTLTVEALGCWRSVSAWPHKSRPAS